MRISRLIIVFAILVMLLISTASQSALPVGSSPPAFIGPANQWINSPPLTWQQLRGKVVLVDFWEYTCVNCIRTDPYLRSWYQRYKPYGLVIVGIQTPEFGFSAVRDNVAGAAKRDNLTYPILNDPASKNWTAYNENYWPSKYLFNQNGKLVYQHTGEGSYQETERAIQKLLLKSHPDAKFPAPLAPVRPGDRPDIMCNTPTGELYVNPTYGFLANLPSDWQRDTIAKFTDTNRHIDGKIYAQGYFITRYQSLQHARTTSVLEDYVVIQFHGTEVNVVINRPQNRDYKVYVVLDNGAVPKKDKGDDIKYDARGSYIIVDAPRMFNVYRGNYGSYQLRLSSDSPDFDIYSYTFGGCPQQ